VKAGGFIYMEDLFDEVMEITTRAHKKKTEKVHEFTAVEHERLDYWVDEMVEHVKKRATNGKHDFSYDCSQISKQMFEELASRFKKKHSKFMVIKDGGLQHITIKWKNSYEV
jgi:ABC-type uncharacterized transport system substrate-binding protein